MTDTVTPAVVNFDGAESSNLVDIWKVPTITGLVQRSKNLLNDLQGDTNGYLAAEYITEDVLAIENSTHSSETEIFELFEITKRTCALERYIDSRSFADIREAFGPERSHLIVSEEVDAGDYGIPLITAA